MNRTIKLIAIQISLCLSLISGQAFAECKLPATPIIPDGNVASEDELIAASKAMKAYQTKLMDHRDCIGGEEAKLNVEAEDYEAKKMVFTKRYDASVDAESALAEEFNVAVRAFKARQK
jgi:hypothetical protein